MWPKGALLAKPAKDINTVTAFTESSNETTAAPVAVEVGTGSPAAPRMVENTVVMACAGVAKSSAAAAAAAATEMDFNCTVELL